MYNHSIWTKNLSILMLNRRFNFYLMDREIKQIHPSSELFEIKSVSNVVIKLLQPPEWTTELNSSMLAIIQSYLLNNDSISP